MIRKRIIALCLVSTIFFTSCKTNFTSDTINKDNSSASIDPKNISSSSSEYNSDSYIIDSDNNETSYDNNEHSESIIVGEKVLYLNNSEFLESAHKLDYLNKIALLDMIKGVWEVNTIANHIIITSYAIIPDNEHGESRLAEMENNKRNGILKLEEYNRSSSFSIYNISISKDGIKVNDHLVPLDDISITYWPILGGWGSENFLFTLFEDEDNEVNRLDVIMYESIVIYINGLEIYISRDGTFRLVQPTTEMDVKIFHDMEKIN